MPQNPQYTSEAERILTESCISFLNKILAELGKVRDTYSSSFKKAKDSGHLYSRRMTSKELKEGLGGVYSSVGDPLSISISKKPASIGQTSPLVIT
jgi:hypothetical protein